jgi:hypothetical protein
MKNETRPTPETDAAYQGLSDESMRRTIKQRTAMQRIERERDELARWKREQMLVESQWDAQAVAKELGMPAGADIRENILPAIQQLKRERNAMLEAMQDAHDALKELRSFYIETTGLPPCAANAALEKLKPFIP